MSGAVRTTCPYCGVGCGVLARPDGTIKGDPAHPANQGRLCSKGAALAETLDDSGRMLHPLVGGARASWDAALDRVAARFRETVAAHGPESVALYVSGQCLTEDYYVANKLMKGFIGSGNIDTNSRLCMASSVAGHTRAFGADVVPGVYEDLEEADLVVLVGSNLAWCHPVLHARLQAARSRRGTRVVVVDPRATATSSGADLHLAIAPGADVALFAGLLGHLAAAGAVDHAWVAAHATGLEAALAAVPDRARVATITGLAPGDIARFFDWFAATERTVTVYSQGVNQSSAGTDKVNAILNCHLATGRIGRPGMGPFSVTGQPNAMGGREVGGLANQLAAHMRFDRPEDLDRVRRFWGAPNLAPQPGLKAVELFEAVREGRVKALWIIATNPADSMPRAAAVREALAACPFVVVSDCWPTDTTAQAHVVLPAAGWGEKDGTVTNSERRISRQRPFRAPPGEARPDWWMLAQVARRMGFEAAFAWESPAAVFREHAALSAFENDGTRVFDIGALAALTDDAYDALEPVRWPFPAGGGEGGRLFARGGFPTPDGRARLVPTVWRPLAARPDAEFPLLLNTGRMRDQWHTMTRTGRVPRLMAHATAPAAAFSPGDAARLGLAEGGLVRLTSPHGTTVLRAAIEPAQQAGEIFVPMHWTDAFAASGPIGRLVGAATDPVSGQPELKATPVRAEAVPAHWRGVLLHCRAIRPEGPHWSRVPVGTGHALELAGTAPLPPGAALRDFVSRLLEAPPGAEWLELADPARGTWRFATLRQGRVEACLFLTTGEAGASLPGGAALAALLEAPVAEAARSGLLAGRAATAACATDRAVCTCFGIGLGALRAAILERRLTDAEAVGAALGAGTNCGSCLPEIREILRDIHADAA
ncbi:nitrate reductase [Roseomonas sp. E05]|uniref:nitrate reductase n=1 Tax=Roseomonas sp. E05 TaxID=3046310 RepID=UPI0024B91028|nr:nitrate reductase [Roseomonas sp. E05]MDJ0391347.1 nitrate reductase [Roseomonas sp. E05]